MEEEDILPANFATHLPGSFKKWQRFDVTDGATDFVDHHINLRGGHGQHLVLDGVSDVRNHLHGVA